MGTLDLVLTVGAIFIGVILLAGKGAVFMGGGNVENRKKEYDQKKMEKASGVTLIAIGIATGIDSFTTGMAAKIVYTVVLVVILAVFLIYCRKKCRK